jgi:phosphotransferase system HPr (HPr) family protein
MIKTYHLTYDRGLHARPAVALAKMIQSFNVKVFICNDGHKSSAHDVLDILSCCVLPGEVTFETVGPDEEIALKAIGEFIDHLNKNPMW